MKRFLPLTGTNALLEEVSPFVPDELIAELVPRRRGRGRRADWSPGQLYRLVLLSLLTPAHSFNLMLAMLREQRAWRRFARLPNRFRLPVASQLHEFRERLGVSGLRRINEHLLAPLIENLPADRLAVSLIDATDLPASTSSFKKSLPGTTRRVEPILGAGPSRRARVVGLSVTRSTPCGCGCANEPKRCA